jgi:hypothetical protein
MTNDQAPMTKQAQMLEAQMIESLSQLSLEHSVIGHSDLFGH